MTSQVEEKYTELIRQGMLPIARWGVPEDVAKAVRAFLLRRFLLHDRQLHRCGWRVPHPTLIGCGFSIWILTGYLFINTIQL